MKFRWKLMLTYLLLTVLMSGVYYLYFEHSSQKFLFAEIKESLLSQARLAKLLAEQPGGPLSSQQFAVKIGSAIKARVTLIDRNGKVTGDSDVSQAALGELENHLMRPEIQDALKGGFGTSVRYSNTRKTDMLYVALAAQNRGNDGFVRLALPLDTLEKSETALHGMASGAAIVSLLVALAFSLFLSKMISRPLREMAASAARVGKTEKFKRISVRTHDEMGELAAVLNDMAERIEQQMHSLSAEKQRLDTILNGMGEGVMVASPSGVITLVNPAFCRMFGISGEVEGKKLIEISRHPDLQSLFNDLNATGGKLTREINIQRSEITLLTHWVPLTVDGSGEGVVAVFHDITDMKRLEGIRRDFVSNVSHELRTPVSVIKGYAETLLEGVITDEPKRACQFAEIILKHSERLATLINDILTLSLLESKTAPLNLHPLDISGTSGKVCMLLAEHAAAKRIVLVNDVPTGLPKVLADQGRLEQVLVNLIDNAIKYTPEAGTVRIYAEPLEDAAIKMYVADTGIGIPPKDLSRIFERFYRVDEARSRDQGGTGLGLSIVKHIIQLHGGEIAVASTPGKGSEFSITLRIA